MQVFNLTLNQMLMMFTLIIAGFILHKAHVLPDNAATVLSRLETYILMPALNMSNMMTQCTPENLGKNAPLMLYGLIIVVVFIVLSYGLCNFFVRPKGDAKKAYESNVYKYALAFGNFGFVGNFLVLNIWGAEVFFQYSLFTFPISIFCYAWGLYLMIPKEAGGSILDGLKKGLLSPPILALFLGAALGLTGLAKYVPTFFVEAMNSAAPCMGPVAMILAGFVIGGYRLSSLFKDVKVYFLVALRLVILPAALVGVLLLLKADQWAVIFSLIAFATPVGMNTIVYPSAYGGDPKTGASMVVISNTLAVLTIPLLFLLFQISV